jgi:prostaglandin-E synthase 1
MSPLGANEAFESYAVCAGILVIKMIASALYTGAQRSKVKGYVNPEDARFGGPDIQATPEEKPEVARALRIQRNDLENIPLFFAIGLVYVLSGASAFGAAVYCWTFTLARIGHTVAYVRGMQPARALLFGVGALANLGMAVNVIWKNL